MRPNFLLTRLPSLAALVAIAGATGCADERKGPATGELDGKCFPNGTCDAGLVCQASGETNVCVEAPDTGTVGGACYDNGTCNPGLVCNGSTCEAAGPDTGTLGGACYGNGTCNSPDLICVADTCEVNNAPHTGMLGGACYENGSCNPGLTCDGTACVSDDTIPAGTLGGACLPNGTCFTGGNPNDLDPQYLICNGTTCEADTRGMVGTNGNACFPNGSCYQGLECIVEVANGSESARCEPEIPVEIGVLDGPCYDNNTCNGGLVCDLGTCVPSGTAVTEPPGADGGLCYANGTCNSGLVCNSFGFCEPIVAGGLFGACTALGGCNLGLDCIDTDLDAAGDTCLPEVEHLASIHGVVTDYITNARLENVEVTIIHNGATQTNVTDALGYYQFDDLQPGHFEVSFASLDGTHTTRRFTDGELEVKCWDGYLIDNVISDQDQHCNNRRDIYLFPFTGTEKGRIWYVNDQEVTPAEGLTVIADYSCLTGSVCSGLGGHYDVKDQGEECGEGYETMVSAVDISPDRFVTTTDADGRFEFTDLPNTGYIGVYISVLPSNFNSFDYEGVSPSWHSLDVFYQDNTEWFLSPQWDPPFLVANNWEDFLYGGYPINEPVVMTFSRSMKEPGCKIGLQLKEGENSWSDVGGTLSWSADGLTATFDPYQPLLTSRMYRVTIVDCESAIDDQPYSRLENIDGWDEQNSNGNLPTDSDWEPDENRHDFMTEDGIELLEIDNGGGCGEVANDICGREGEFGADDNIVITFDQAPDITVDGAGFEFFRVICTYPGHHDPQSTETEGDANITLVPEPATITVVDNTIVVDPTNTLVANAEYRLVGATGSALANDIVVLQTIEVCVSPEDQIYFMFANLPVVASGRLETLDGAQNIVLTFTKDVNIALSRITLEDDSANQFDGPDNGTDCIPPGDDDDCNGYGLTLAHTDTADGAAVTIDPAEDLAPGFYTIRYNVVAADGQGVATGHLTFEVVTAATGIALVDDNLGTRDAVYAGRNIILDFNTAVQENDPRAVLLLVDEDGNDVSPETYRVQDSSTPVADWNNDGDSQECDDTDLECVEDGRVRFSAVLKPNTTYTLTGKIYADAGDDHVDSEEDDSTNNNTPTTEGEEFGTYVEFTITFTTAPQITLVSTNAGTVTDANENGLFDEDNCVDTGDTSDGTDVDEVACGDEFEGTVDFVSTANITLEFSVAPDTAAFHPIQYVRLWRQVDDENSSTSTFQLVGANTTVSGTTVTIDPVENLDAPGARFCITYGLTSAQVFVRNNLDEVLDITEIGDGENAADALLANYTNDDDTDTAFESNANPFADELCFETASPATVLPVVPGAVTGFSLTQGSATLDHDADAVNVQWTRLTNAINGTDGELYYEIFAVDVSGEVEDSLLIARVEDDPDSGTFQTLSPSICGNLSGAPVLPIFCNPEADPNWSMPTFGLDLDDDGDTNGVTLLDFGTDNTPGTGDDDTESIDEEFGWDSRPLGLDNVVRLVIRACNDAGCSALSATPVLAQDLRAPTGELNQAETCTVTALGLFDADNDNFVDEEEYDACLEDTGADFGLDADEFDVLDGGGANNWDNPDPGAFDVIISVSEPVDQTKTPTLNFDQDDALADDCVFNGWFDDGMTGSFTCLVDDDRNHEVQDDQPQDAPDCDPNFMVVSNIVDEGQNIGSTPDIPEQEGRADGDGYLLEVNDCVEE